MLASVRSDRMFPTVATQSSHLTRLLSKFLLKLELAVKHLTGGRIRTYITHSSDLRCSRCDQSAGPKTVKQEQRAAGRNDTAVIVVRRTAVSSFLAEAWLIIRCLPVLVRACWLHQTAQSGTTTPRPAPNEWKWEKKKHPSQLGFSPLFQINPTLWSQSWFFAVNCEKHQVFATSLF